MRRQSILSKQQPFTVTSLRLKFGKSNSNYRIGDNLFTHSRIIALASATGEKKKKQKLGPPRQGQGGAEGPDAGSFGGGGGRRPRDDSAEHRRPPKKVFEKVEKLASAIYTRLCKTQNSAI